MRGAGRFVFGRDLAVTRPSGGFMESRVKVLGHPLHPMLVVVPLGSFIAAVIVDVIGVVAGNPTLSVVGFWNIAVGVVGGLLAAAFGLADWLNIPRKTR